MVSTTLLETAIDQFGRHGFEGASTREIARASGTAMSSITYHFGGKHGLYLAAADHIAAAILAAQGPALEAARAAADSAPEQATEALLALVDSLAQMMLSPETEAWARFIIREQQAPSEAFQRLYAGGMHAIADTAIALIARIRPDLGDRDIRATCMLLFGQVLVLRAARAAVCRVMQVATIDAETEALLRSRLRVHVRHILSEKP